MVLPTTGRRFSLRPHTELTTVARRPNTDEMIADVAAVQWMDGDPAKRTLHTEVTR